MTAKEQKKAAEAFVAYWMAQRGSETGEDQTFWSRNRKMYWTSRRQNV